MGASESSENDNAPRWWKYAVIRGEGVPASLDGRWYDLDAIEAGTSTELPPTGPSSTLEATNRWEQREDGEVAVVYEWTRRDERHSGGGGDG